MGWSWDSFPSNMKNLNIHFFPIFVSTFIFVFLLPALVAKNSEFKFYPKNREIEKNNFNWKINKLIS